MLSPGGGRAEERPRRIAVAADLRRERVHRVEMRLVAQLLQELDGEAAPVEVAGEIEEECFESRRAAVAHGRVDSEARHSLESASCCTEAFYRIDPLQRGPGASQAHVGGGKAHLAAAPRAVHHAPADRIGPAEEARGVVELA